MHPVQQSRTESASKLSQPSQFHALTPQLVSRPARASGTGTLGILVLNRAGFVSFGDRFNRRLKIRFPKSDFGLSVFHILQHPQFESDSQAPGWQCGRAGAANNPEP